MRLRWCYRSGAFLLLRGPMNAFLRLIAGYASRHHDHGQRDHCWCEMLGSSLLRLSFGGWVLRSLQ